MEDYSLMGYQDSNTSDLFFDRDYWQNHRTNILGISDTTLVREYGRLPWCIDTDEYKLTKRDIERVENKYKNNIVDVYYIYYIAFRHIVRMMPKQIITEVGIENSKEERCQVYIPQLIRIKRPIYIIKDEFFKLLDRCTPLKFKKTNDIFLLQYEELTYEEIEKLKKGKFISKYELESGPIQHLDVMGYMLSKKEEVYPEKLMAFEDWFYKYAFSMKVVDKSLYSKEY